MPDITMCLFGKDCPLGAVCFRALAKASDRQSYFREHPNLCKNGKERKKRCAHFWPAPEKHRITIPMPDFPCFN